MRDDKQKDRQQQLQEPARRLELYIPTHRDEAAMNGAPDRLWLIERKQATAQAKYGVSPLRSSR
jgi:hypothetical protein